MNYLTWVEITFFHLCLEVTPQCTEINALPVFECGFTFDPLKVKKKLT
jgi:hypothetical protein